VIEEDLGLGALRLDQDPGQGPKPATAAKRIRQVVGRVRRGEPGFGPAEAVMATATADVAHFLHPHFDDGAALEEVATGVPASPGAASGRVVLSADTAIEASDRGEAVILVRPETGPEDVLGMQAAVGTLTARGGLAATPPLSPGAGAFRRWSGSGRWWSRGTASSSASGAWRSGT